MKPTPVHSFKAHKAISCILFFAVYCTLCICSTVQAQTVTKQFYLSDPSQALDRVDPVATADATLAQTAALTPTSQYLYAFRGASRTDFWRFTIATNTWTAMTAAPGTVSRGAALATNGTYIYALRGAATDFWRYDPAANTWAVMASTPAAVTNGASLVHVNGIIYAFQGGSATFWKYTIATNTWAALAATPGTAAVGWGGSLTTNGTDIFALRGNNTTTFWRYTVASNTWSVLATVPLAVEGGGSLSFDGSAIYALRGINSNNFYKYTLSTNTWSALANTTATVFKGGAIASDDPTSYALRGAASNSFYSFNGTAWSALSNTPSNVDSGAALIKFGVVGKTTTFTKAPAFCGNFTIKAGTVSVTTYASMVYGTIPAAPAMTAVLKYGTTTIITLSSPAYNSGTGLITWTGTLASDVTIPSGQALALDITTSQPGASFKIDYDSQTKPSKIAVQTSTNVTISSVNVYNAPYPLGSIVSSVMAGATRYIRTTVTNPSGFTDITGLTLTVTPGAVLPSVQVAGSGCTKIYESIWLIPLGQPTFTIGAVAKDGYENTITNSSNVIMGSCTSCPPTANLNYATGNGGEPVVIDVLANDTDPNNDIDSASLNILVEPKNGDVIIDDNKITYLPNGTFQGNDTLTYEICDNSSPTPLCSSAQVIITVLPVAFNTCADVSQPKTYYIPYAEDYAQIALKKSTSVALATTNIRTIISIKISYPGLTLTWDHWEDGYESNILSPTQSTTQVWGDGNLYNGIAPGYPTDVIPPGANIVLDNTMATPRVAGNIFYDGKDKLYSTGQISVTQVCGEPSTIAVQCMKTNVTSFPNEYGKQFTIPVGQDLPSRDFRYTALFIRAAQNNTTVQIDRDNNGTFNTSFVLNEGQVMMVDDNTAPAGTQIKAGAVITSDKPIGVDAHFGGVDYPYSSREVPVFPATWYSHTYYTPVPTTGPGTTAPLDTAVVMLYNSLGRDLNINWSSGIPSSGTILLRANASYRFAMPLTASAAFKFENPTKESFVALEIADSYSPGGGGNDGSTRDWAFNLISEARLTDFASVAWAPGSTDMTRNDNPIWITPNANTTVYVKYDGDILNGVSTSPCGLKYDVAIPVNYLSYIKIKDASDNNQSGTAVYTCNGAKIAAVYGEDASTALVADPSWDVGSTMQPFCKEKLIVANDDWAVTLVNTPVTINVIKNDKGFLSIIDPRTVTTTGLLQPLHGTLIINKDGTIVYVPNVGYTGQDTFQYSVCSTPSPVICATAYVYITIGSCPSPTGMNIISGQVFLDKNQDGVKNDGGTGISPAKIYLYVDGNCNGTANPNELIDSVNVDLNGYYQFIKAPEKIIADNFDLPAGGNSCASGSDGNAPWKNDWSDSNDPSSGFCQTSGSSADVEVVQDSIFGYALRLDDVTRSATREFNMQNATKAFLNFTYRKATTSLSTGESVLVQLSSDGNTFNTVYTIAGNSTYNSNYVPVDNISINVATYNSSNKAFLRFVTTSNVDEGDNVFIDNISIKFLQYNQCYLVGIVPSSLPANVSLTTGATKSFTFATAGTCASTMDFGVKRILTYSVNDENSTWQNVNVSGVVKINDFDQEGNTQTFGTFLNPANMAVLPNNSVVRGTDKTGAMVANAGQLSYTAATGNYTFDPSPTFTGTVTIPYKICDGGSPSACDTSYLIITVDPLPAAGNSVIANNDEDISYGAAITGNLLVNDQDPKNYAFTVTLFSYDSNGDRIPDITTIPGTVTVAGLDIYNNVVPNAGSLTITASGTYTFTPTAGFIGSVDASYVIANTAGSVATANLRIDVLDDINGIQNNPPFAGDDFEYTTVNQPVTGSFISNDRDSNGDSLSYNGTTIVTASMANTIGAPVATIQGGAVQFYSNGTYKYTPPAGYVGPDYVTYSICDVTTTAPQPLCANAIIHFLVGPGIAISGKVWDDANGNVIDPGAAEPETNCAGTLYVNLVDASGYVVASAAVAANGTYSFSDVAPGLSYSLVLSTTQGAVGTPAPASSLPANWVNTGETRNGTIDYGSMGVIDNRVYGFTDAVNLDFGIEQIPSSLPFYYHINQPVVGQMTTLNGGGNPPVLSGQDGEDCTSVCTLDNRSVIIDQVPANANLYYNGVLVTSGQLITNFNPALFQIEFTAVTLGSQITQFNYSFVDAAGQKDPVSAIYSLNWLSVLPAKGLELTALRAGKNAMLYWKTISEINSDYFEIERSTDGRNYTKVGSNQKAAGNSNAETQYQTTDDVSSLQVPLVYYRIKLLDNNRKYAYSNVATVKLPENGAVMKVVPNPFISEITITISVEQNSSFGIRMMDMSGRTISTSSQKITTDAPNVTLRNLNGLIRGMYLVEITDAASGKKRVFKVEKIN